MISPKKREIIIIIGLIVIVLLSLLQFGCNKNSKPISSNPGDTVIVAPLTPYDPHPSDGAVDVGDEFTFSWQCYNPDSASFEYIVYLGIDSMIPVLGGPSNRANCLMVPWRKQARANRILIQVYQMQMAYRNQNGSYCLNGTVASRANPNAFNLIDVTIDSIDGYTYSMCAAINMFTCVATANIDNDATNDTWQIDQTSVLDNTICDFTDFNPIEFRPATTYSWRVLVLTNADRDSTWGPVWHFTTTPGIIPPGHSIGLPRYPMPAEYSTGVTCSTYFTWYCMRPEGDSLTYDFYLNLGDKDPELVNQNLSANQTYPDWGKQWHVRKVLRRIWEGQQYFKLNNGYYGLDGAYASYGNDGFRYIGVRIEIIDIYNYDMYATTNTFSCSAVADIDGDGAVDLWTIDQDGTIRHVSDDSEFPLLAGALYSWKVVARDSHGNEYEGPIWHFTTSN